MNHVIVTLAMLACAVPVQATTPNLGSGETEVFKLLASDGSSSDRFGFSIAASGTMVIVGARYDDNPGHRSGSAYLFDTRSGQELRKLRPLDTAADDHFGSAVAISGTRAIVGAPRNDDSGSGSGSAYLFNLTTGQQIVKLLASDALPSDGFGHAVAISGSMAVVAAAGRDDNGPDSGSAYLFDAITGQQTAKLLPGDGASTDNFGVSVAISVDACVVGAFLDDDLGTDSGSAYVFDAATGTQVFKLLASDGRAGDLFGLAIATSGRTAAVGAPHRDEASPDAGAVYLFDTVSGAQTAKLIPREVARVWYFGQSVAIDGTTAIVGAIIGPDSFGPGVAYLFDTTTGTQIGRRLQSSDLEPHDRFATSVGISGTVVAIGAHRRAEHGFSVGAAYVFEVPTDTPYCFGTACPCGNDDHAAGCVNSTGSGASLEFCGTARIHADDGILTATNCPPGNIGLCFAADTAFDPPAIVGDGLGCAGGSSFRYRPQYVDSTGTLVQSRLVASSPPGFIQPGDTRHFQVWSRDVLCGPPPAPCPTPCGVGANTTHGVSITFGP